jgi:hypothetical protein
VLLRLQGRVAIDPATVKADLERLASGKAAPSAPAPSAAAKGGAPASPLDGLDFSVKE